MKLLLALLSFTLLSFNGLAQSTIAITGQIKDDATKENISFCKIVALNMQDSVIAGAYSDDAGFFKIPVLPNAYKLIVNAYGFQSDTLQLGIVRQDLFVGVIKLKTEVLEVGEVTVEASSRVEKLDRDVQVITDDLKKGATAAKDVLNKITGITFDQYTGTLKVDADANIMILVNGVEKNQEYVQNLDPDRLLKVETIRDPGGRYGLEGYSAVINIILKDDYIGTEVYIEQMNLVDIITDQSRLDYLIGSLGVTYNYTKNKVNFYLGARGERKNFNIFSNSQTNYADGFRIEEFNENGASNIEVFERDAYYTLGLDYRINPKHVVSFESYTSAFPINNEDLNVHYETEAFLNDSLVQKYSFNSTTNSKRITTYNTLFYIANFDEKNKLNINFTHSFYTDNYASKTIQQSIYKRLENGNNLKHFTRFNAEFDHTINGKMDVQLGYGNNFSSQKNTFDVNQLFNNGTATYTIDNSYQQTEFRNKLYANYSLRWTKKWGMRLGLAAEHSVRNTPGQTLNFVILQPIFDLKYSPSGKYSFNFKYRTDSDYPGIAQTNPFVSLVNPRITQVGNPDLSPTTIHRFSVRMNLLGGLIALEPYSNWSKNYVVKVGTLDTNTIFNFHYENAEVFNRNGLRMNFNKYFKFNFLFQGNIDLYQSRIVSSVQTNTIMDCRVDVDAIYIFPKSQMLLGLKYQRNLNKVNNGLGYDKGDVDFWMLFYKTPLFKQRGSVLLGYFLPLDFGMNYNQGSYVSTTGFEVRTNNDVSLIKNMFLVEFNFRINKGKSVKKVEKNVEKEEENKGGIF